MFILGTLIVVGVPLLLFMFICTLIANIILAIVKGCIEGTTEVLSDCIDGKKSKKKK